MSKPLFRLCSNPRSVMRDGWAGSNAKITLPFNDVAHGFWWANGAIYTFPSSTIAQYEGQSIGGRTMADTFQKSCCSCPN